MTCQSAIARFNLMTGESLIARSALRDRRMSGLAPRRRPAAGRDLRFSALQSEEAPLGREATGVATQAAVGRDDPVARDDDRDRVRAESGAGGARCLLVPSLPRDDLVGRE